MTRDQMSAFNERLEQLASKSWRMAEKERIEAERATKLRPTVAQAEPSGLFEQQQGLFK
jgi:hypothetical protein